MERIYRKDKIVPNNQKLHSYYVGEVGDWIQCVACGYRLYYEETYIPKNYCPNCGALIDWRRINDL